MDARGVFIMTKKHTLLVAILVNASLLTLLFVTAITDAPSSKTGSSLADITPDKVERLESKESLLAKDREREEESPLKDLIHKLPPIENKKEEEALAEKKTALVQEPASEKEHFAEKPLSEQIVRVEPGDNLEKLAKRYGASVEAIQRANNLPTGFLKIGQTLKIPLKQEVLQEKKPTHPNPLKVEKKKEEPGFYLVKSGDNPWTIAMKHHMKVEDLLRLNQLDEKKAKRLKPGDKLRIR